ncbi:MAG: phage integrase N-terminal SAM-like domain-containing protein [Hahellaceae bacterium]|nr:phage integrase N-terminal SAM-like domain-containing protein [Hahellaceae bacterium]MCP5169280.1 phage integrase N-terminal SAM-like domain-containing protein [Hahellaceae bacterium]
MEYAGTLDQSQSGLLGSTEKALKKTSLSNRTRQMYQHWITQYIYFYDLKNPADLNEESVKRYLGYLAQRLKLSRAKLNQAKEALGFLYEKVLGQPLATLTA